MRFALPLLSLLSGCLLDLDDLDYRLDHDQDGVRDDIDCDENDPAVGGPNTWWGDEDNDGHGGIEFVEACEQPERFVSTTGDCDDRNPAVNPGIAEVCNEIDDNCDNQTDEGVEPATWYVDYDGDQFGDEAWTRVDCNRPPGFAAEPGDCDDRAATVNPAAQETCSGADDDCDGLIDLDDPDLAGEASWYPDSDGDGFGRDMPSITSCTQPPGHVRSPGDCDDTDVGTFPGAVEICEDGLDQDCDGEVDNLAVPATWYADLDGDGFGDPLDVQIEYQCIDVPGLVSNPLDCNDSNADVNPLAEEVCDGIDNDCDGLTDAADPDITDVDAVYADDDGDGYGAGDPLATCVVGPGQAGTNDDCDDANSDVHPFAAEACDGIDNDCDGDVDDDDDNLISDPWFTDADSDGYGGGPPLAASCTQPPGSSALNGDCNDSDPYTSPGATDICGDGLDQDCNGTVDDTQLPASWYVDADMDGWGDPDQLQSSSECSPPAGFSSVGADCDDSDDTVAPDADEICDGLDNNCDGHIDLDDNDLIDAQTWLADIDGDGFGDDDTAVLACEQPTEHVLVGGDCDDLSVDAYPGAHELCNGLDEDCDGAVDEGHTPHGTWYYRDADGDDFGDVDLRRRRCEAPAGFVADDQDCDDTDPTVNPAAVEVCGDGLDNNCNGPDATCAGPLGDILSEDIVDIVTSSDSGMRAGWSLANAGDQNGDGNEDLLVGAPWRDGAGTRRGAAYLVYGPVTGTNALGSITLRGVLDDSETGDGLADHGDVNNDGNPDFMVSCHKSPKGQAYLLLGPVTSTMGLHASDAIIRGEADDSHFGEALAIVDDHNGDGFADMLFGAHSDDLVRDKGGAVYFLEGSANPSTVNILGAAEAIYTPENDGDLGKAVADAGDVDGDGLGDLLMSADWYGTDHGRTYLFVNTGSGTQSAGSADATVTGATDGERSGVAIAGVGDVNEDGFDDILIGAPNAKNDGNNAGAGYLIHGPLSGDTSVNAADAILKGTTQSLAGSAVAPAGDYNGDALPDLWVGAPDDDNEDLNAGASYIVLSPVTGTMILADDADVRLWGEAQGHRFGSFAAPLDANGDGLSDLAIGAYGGTVPGAVYMLFGQGD